MIYIRNSAGLDLVLSNDQHLTLEQAAGWLQDDTLPGAKSYPISFPVEPNEAFLSSGYRPDAARPVMEFPVTVQFQNVLYRRCTLSYQITEGKGDGYLKIDGGEVFSRLKKLTLQQAFTATVSLETSIIKQLAARMFEIAALPPGQFPLTFFPIRNEGFWEEGLDESKVAGFVRQPYVNAWSTQGFKIDTSTVRGYPVVPFFYLTWVLEQIFARAGYAVEGDWMADIATKRLVILNQTAISARQITVLNPVPHLVTPGVHLPEMTVGDFLKAVRQRYGLQYSFNSTRQVVTIRQFSKIIQSTPVDLTRYVVGKFGIEAPQNQGFSIVDYIDPSDELYKDTKGNTVDPAGLTIGGNAENEPEVIKLSAGACQVIYEKGVTLSSAKWMVPTVFQPGNTVDVVYKASDRSPDNGRLRNQMGLRIISYYGLIPDSVGVNYPLATPDGRNGRQEVIASQSSNLAGRDGIWIQTLRNLYYFRDQTRRLTVNLNLPTGVAAGLDLHTPISLQLQGQTRRRYLIEKLQCESPGPSGLMESKLFAYTIPDGLDLLDLNPPVRVWVEWIVGPEVRVNLPQTPGHGIGEYKYVRSYTVRFWQDQAKTTPATVLNLPLTVRRKHTTYYNTSTSLERKEYLESQIIYYASGQSFVLEAEYISVLSLLVINDSGSVSDGYNSNLQLDPGDDYNIL